MKNILIFILWLISFGGIAQEFDSNIQIRPRFESRNGYRSFLPNGVAPSNFISQRTRVNFNFNQEKIDVHLAMQNVRVWGDVPTTTKADANGMEIYEAWGQYDYTEHWKIRLGRQALSYDNQRIMSQSDWAQSGQSQDAVLVRYQDKRQQLDMAYSYSALSESDVVVNYTVNNYKSMQLLWYNRQWQSLSGSLLFINAGYQELLSKPIPDPLPSLKQDFMQTFGTYWHGAVGAWQGSFGVYGQTGKFEKCAVGAWYLGGNVDYNFTKKMGLTLGYELLSGKAQDDTSTMIRSFYPKNGANHAFNGNLDYFYVSNYQNNAGLKDGYLKLNYISGKWDAMLTGHLFFAANTVLDTSHNKMNPYYGFEEDFLVKRVLQKYVVVSGGYSQIFGTKTLEVIKGAPSNRCNNWTWLMVSFSPQLFYVKNK